MQYVGWTCIRLKFRFLCVFVLDIHNCICSNISDQNDNLIQNNRHSLSLSLVCQRCVSCCRIVFLCSMSLPRFHLHPYFVDYVI